MLRSRLLISLLFIAFALAAALLRPLSSRAEDGTASAPAEPTTPTDTNPVIPPLRVVLAKTAKKKKRIRDSRVVSTQSLSNALATAATPPKTFICASAIGYYGSRGDEILNEESPSGTGFLAEVCREWEAATEAAAHAGIRAVNLRIGLVLSPNGGALKQMLWPFRLGLGGKVGSGRQWWSWIHIEDLVFAVHHILQNNFLKGPVNMTAPSPVTNSEFTQILAGVLKRPAILSVSAFAARLAFGEFADEGLLASARVMPRMLMESGFEFRNQELQPALKDFL